MQTRPVHAVNQCGELRRGPPSLTGGHRNAPCSSRSQNSTRPEPPHATIFIRSARLARNTKIIPQNGSCPSFAEIDRLGRDQQTHSRRDRDHVTAFTARRTVSNAPGSVPGGTRTAPITISISRDFRTAGEIAGPDSTITHPKPFRPPLASSARLRASRRHPNNCRGVNPCRRATALTDAPISSNSATICAFCSGVQVRRHPDSRLAPPPVPWITRAISAASASLSAITSRIRVRTIRFTSRAPVVRDVQTALRSPATVVKVSGAASARVGVTASWLLIFASISATQASACSSASPIQQPHDELAGSAASNWRKARSAI
jgi:hypothetical protein